MAAAKKAEAFYNQFPNNTNAVRAKFLECLMLREACVNGGKDAFSHWERAQNVLASDSRLTGNLRYLLQMQVAERISIDPGVTEKVRNAEYETALWGLVKHYPEKRSPYERLVEFAGQSSDEKARTIADEILAQKAPIAITEQAQAILHRLDALGRPLEIHFKSLDDRRVDLGKMKGKVVMLDFWATWCAPCVERVPEIKKAYEAYQSRGLIIIGISLDKSKPILDDFLKSKNMPWPEYFDGESWQSKFVVQCSIQYIPALWLVDKKGNLRYEDATTDLQRKIEKLLAE